MPTIQELQARIAALEAQLHPIKRRSPQKRAERNWAKARKAQFKLDAQKRARLHCSINRYAR